MCLLEPLPQELRCSFPSCPRKSLAKGLCSNHYVQKAYAKNREKIREQAKRRYKERYSAYEKSKYSPEFRRAKALYSKYGLSLEEFKELEQIQKGVCAICLGPPSLSFHRKGVMSKVLQVDHDHKTGMVRGLLCGKCNIGLGTFQDSIDFLLKAVEYLQRSKCHAKS